MLWTQHIIATILSRRNENSVNGSLLSTFQNEIQFNTHLSLLGCSFCLCFSSCLVQEVLFMLTYQKSLGHNSQDLCHSLDSKLGILGLLPDQGHNSGTYEDIVAKFSPGLLLLPRKFSVLINRKEDNQRLFCIETFTDMELDLCCKGFWEIL